MLSGLKNLALPLAAFAAGLTLAVPDARAQWAFPGFSQTRPPQEQPAPQSPPPASRGENFSAKPPAQLFVSDCTGSGCHKGPQGLGKDRSRFSLASFLRAHYTNSRESAAAMAAYLASLPGETRAARPERQPRAAARPDDAPKPADDAPRARRATPPADAGEAPKPAAKPQRERGRQATAAPPLPPAPAAPEPPPEPAPPPEPPKPKWDIFD